MKFPIWSPPRINAKSPLIEDFLATVLLWYIRSAWFLAVKGFFSIDGVLFLHIAFIFEIVYCSQILYKKYSRSSYCVQMQQLFPVSLY